MGSEEEEASADWVAGDPQGGAGVGGAVNEFPVAAVKITRNLETYNKTHPLLCSSGDQKSKLVFWAKIKAS